MTNVTKKNNEGTTVVLQDLGGSDKLKISFVLGNISEKIKNWEGFPQTSQSHKTLANSLRNRTEKTKNGKISSLIMLLNKSNRIWN